MSAADFGLAEVTTDFAVAISEQLQPYTGYVTGQHLTVILVIKGVGGIAEAAGEPLFSGADGDALEKAFVALGWGQHCWLGVLLQPLGAPELNAESLRKLVEIVDPLVVVSLDEVARLALVEAFASTEAGLLASFLAGTTETVLGRRFVSVDGFEASLANTHEKQLAWAQLKEAERP